MDFNIEKFIKLMKPFVEQSYTTKNSVIDNIFYQPGSKSDNWNFGSLNNDGNNILMELHKYYNLPKELIYSYLGLTLHTDELVYNDFSFMSLAKIKEINNEHLEKGQKDFLDIGMCYAGMGYCFVLAWHKEIQLFFFRMDGGSNGYDVENNYNRFIINKINFNKLHHKMINWNQLKNLLDNNTDDFFEKIHKACI